MELLEGEQKPGLVEQLGTLLAGAGGWIRTHFNAASQPVAEACSEACSSAARKVSALAAGFTTSLLANQQTLGAPCCCAA